MQVRSRCLALVPGSRSTCEVLLPPSLHQLSIERSLCQSSLYHARCIYSCIEHEYCCPLARDFLELASDEQDQRVRRTVSSTHSTLCLSILRFYELRTPRWIGCFLKTTHVVSLCQLSSFDCSGVWYAATNIRVQTNLVRVLPSPSHPLQWSLTRVSEPESVCHAVRHQVFGAFCFITVLIFIYPCACSLMSSQLRLRHVQAYDVEGHVPGGTSC